jgi:hypothetical protein
LDLELLFGIGLLVSSSQRLPLSLILKLGPFRCSVCVVVDTGLAGFLLQTLLVLGDPVDIGASGVVWQSRDLKPRLL